MPEAMRTARADRLLTPGFTRLLVAQACFGYAFSSYFLLPKYLVTQLHAGPAEIGHVTALYGLFVVCCLPAMGVVVDRFGRRDFLTAGAVVMAARFARVRRRRPRGSAALRAAGDPGHCLRDGLRRGCDAGRRRGAARAPRPGDRDLRPDLPGDERDRPGGLGGDRAARGLARDVRDGGRAGARQRGALAPPARAAGGAAHRTAPSPACSRWRCGRASCA